MSKTNKRKTKKTNEKKLFVGRNKKNKIQEEPIVSENMPIIFSWSTVDYKSNSFTEFSFIAAAIGAMAMIGWGIYNGNFVMVMTFITMVVVIILVLNDKPRKVEVVISETGIDLNGEHFNYNAF
ncbi:hypothetical protein KKD57_05195, partial [Patescibacteria group bacterium]|nr:hypothetical protein [Patescibacteria group bacterium]